MLSTWPGPSLLLSPSLLSYPVSPCHRHKPRWCLGHRRAIGPHCLNPAPAGPWAPQGFPKHMRDSGTKSESSHPQHSRTGLSQSHTPVSSTHQHPGSHLPSLFQALRLLPNQQASVKNIWPQEGWGARWYKPRPQRGL